MCFSERVRSASILLYPSNSVYGVTECGCAGVRLCGCAVVRFVRSQIVMNGLTNGSR